MENKTMSYEEYVKKTFDNFYANMKAYPEEDLRNWFNSLEIQATVKGFYQESLNDHNNGVRNAFNDGGGYSLALMYDEIEDEDEDEDEYSEEINQDIDKDLDRAMCEYQMEKKYGEDWENREERLEKTEKTTEEVEGGVYINPAINSFKGPDKNYVSQIFATTNLVSQNMNVSLDFFDQYDIEDGERHYKFRFIAEDEVSYSVIDLDLYGSVNVSSIKSLINCLHKPHCKNGEVVCYSWGCLEFTPYVEENEVLMMMDVYPEDIPVPEEYRVLKYNRFILNFDSEEVQKFKKFLIKVYEKITQIENDKA